MPATLLSSLPDPGSRAPRYSSRPFPAYRYVPGQQPHPRRDAAGHSYEPQPQLRRAQPWDAEDWAALEAWGYGIDLFNHFYFWEAHESWEELWAASARDEPPSLLLQGLIQIAAALLKTHMQVAAGAIVLSREGLEKLAHAAARRPQLMGLDLPRTQAAFVRYFAPLASGALPPLDASVPVLTLSR